jgi:hypothetical protein
MQYGCDSARNFAIKIRKPIRRDATLRQHDRVAKVDKRDLDVQLDRDQRQTVTVLEQSLLE